MACILGFVCYLYEFILTISGVNNYCDITRIIPCAGDNNNPTEVYDVYIKSITYYRMIEWIKWCIYITSISMKLNMIYIFYFLHLNLIYGFVVMT